jgi:hypothetical protein
MKYVRISVAQLANLLRNNHELNALENWGVDNWIGYGDHHSEDNEWEDWDDLSNEDVVTMNGFTIRDTDDLIG